MKKHSDQENQYKQFVDAGITLSDIIGHMRQMQSRNQGFSYNYKFELLCQNIIMSGENNAQFILLEPLNGYMKKLEAEQQKLEWENGKKVEDNKPITLKELITDSSFYFSDKFDTLFPQLKQLVNNEPDISSFTIDNEPLANYMFRWAYYVRKEVNQVKEGNAKNEVVPEVLTFEQRKELLNFLVEKIPEITNKAISNSENDFYYQLVSIDDSEILEYVLNKFPGKHEETSLLSKCWSAPNCFKLLINRNPNLITSDVFFRQLYMTSPETKIEVTSFLINNENKTISENFKARMNEPGSYSKAVLAYKRSLNDPKLENEIKIIANQKDQKTFLDAIKSRNDPELEGTIRLLEVNGAKTSKQIRIELTSEMVNSMKNLTIINSQNFEEVSSKLKNYQENDTDFNKTMENGEPFFMFIIERLNQDDLSFEQIKGIVSILKEGRARVIVQFDQVQDLRSDEKYQPKNANGVKIGGLSVLYQKNNAATNELLDLAEALPLKIDGLKEKISELLAQGADIDATIYDNTPLVLSLVRKLSFQVNHYTEPNQGQLIDFIDFLIEKGAKIESCTIEGYSKLEHISSYHRRNIFSDVSGVPLVLDHLLKKFPKAVDDQKFYKIMNLSELSLESFKVILKHDPTALTKKDSIRSITNISFYPTKIDSYIALVTYLLSNENQQATKDFKALLNNSSIGGSNLLDTLSFTMEHDVSAINQTRTKEKYDNLRELLVANGAKTAVELKAEQQKLEQQKLEQQKLELEQEGLEQQEQEQEQEQDPKNLILARVQNYARSGGDSENIIADLTKLLSETKQVEGYDADLIDALKYMVLKQDMISLTIKKIFQHHASGEREIYAKVINELFANADYTNPQDVFIHNKFAPSIGNVILGQLISFEGAGLIKKLCENKAEENHQQYPETVRMIAKSLRKDTPASFFTISFNNESLDTFNNLKFIANSPANKTLIEECKTTLQSMGEAFSQVQAYKHEVVSAVAVSELLDKKSQYSRNSKFTGAGGGVALFGSGALGVLMGVGVISGTLPIIAAIVGAVILGVAAIALLSVSYVLNGRANEVENAAASKLVDNEGKTIVTRPLLITGELAIPNVEIEVAKKRFNFAAFEVKLNQLVNKEAPQSDLSKPVALGVVNEEQKKKEGQEK